jgi:hypothetical protein
MIAYWFRWIQALPTCILSPRYEFEDARARMQFLAVRRGVHTVTRSCPVCDGWHIASK